MNAYEKYAKTLSYHLPAHLREEVVREVMGGLHAELDAARAASPSESDERLMRGILQGRQSARSLAAAFAEGRSALIGPRVYPTYRAVLWISLVVTGVTVASLSLLFGFDWSLLGDLAIASVVVFTCITLIFVAIDQFDALRHVAESMAADRSMSEEPAGDDPVAESPATVARPRVARWNTALMLLVFLNLAPNLVGLLLVIAPGWHVVAYPILSSTFLGLPRLLVSAWCVAVLVIDGLALLGRAGAQMPRLQTALALFGLVVGLAVLLSGPLFAVPSAQVTGGWPIDLVKVMNQTIAPYLFRTLTAVFWLGVLLRLGWMLRSVLRGQHTARLSF